MPTIPLHPKAKDAIDAQLRAFEKKFGRAAGPDDPVFFDPDLDIPVQIAKQKMEDQVVVAMAAASVRPELIWIYLKTGLMLTKEKRLQMSAEDNRDVEQAVREYRQDNPDLTLYFNVAKERLAANAYYEKA